MTEVERFIVNAGPMLSNTLFWFNTKVEDRQFCFMTIEGAVGQLIPMEVLLDAVPTYAESEPVDERFFRLKLTETGHRLCVAAGVEL